MKIAIVGAGIAGLTAALTLRSEGIDVVVLEQAQELRESGAGIQIASNGTKILRQFGIEPLISKVAALPDFVDYIDLESGALLVSRPLGREAEARYGGACYQIHRGDLLNGLIGVLPENVVRFDARCIDLKQDSRCVALTLQTGEVLRADGVIGADGIHSFVRKQLFGNEETKFANLLSWRALIPAERLRDLDLGNAGYIWTGPGRSVVSYWVRPKELFNFVGTVPSTEVHREAWTDGGDTAALVRSFSGSEPRLSKIVGAVESAFITGLYYRDPAESWTKGRVTLIGDAAHPMLPFLAQGACQGIEDAAVLAKCLARSGILNLPEALNEYEARRRPRTTRVQSAARSTVKVLHETDPVKIKARNGQWRGVAQLDPISETAWGWLYRYDAVVAAADSVGDVVGLAAIRENVKMQRPVAQRAFDLRKVAFTPEDVARGIDGLREGYDRFLLTNFPLPKDRSATVVQSPVQGYWVTSSEQSETVVLHFHGGGYVIGSAQASLEYASRLAGAVRGKCFAVDYRLAPEHPFPAALDDAVAAYRYVRSMDVGPQNIILSGESSGGGLAIALALALRESGETLPAGVVAISPFTDLTLSGPSIDQRAGLDPTATRDGLTALAGSYIQEHDPRHPLISPLFADLVGLPPILVLAASNEGLASDSTRFVDRAKTAGVDVIFKAYDDSVHVFSLYPFLPEAKAAIDEIAAFAIRLRTQE